MCENCLNFKHVASSCRKCSFCSVDNCSKKHHTLLHKPSLSRVNHDMSGHSNCCTKTDVVMSGKVSLLMVPVIVQYGSRKTEKGSE